MRSSKLSEAYFSELSLQIQYLDNRILIVCTGSSGEIFVFIKEGEVKRLLNRSLRFHRRIEAAIKADASDKGLSATRRRRLSRYLTRLGQYLFNLVFKTPATHTTDSDDVISDLLNVAIGQAIYRNTDVRIRLVIATDFLNLIPWEILCDDGMFLCHTYDLFRHPFALQPVRRPSLPNDELKVLFAAANPRNNIFVKGQIEAVHQAIEKIHPIILEPGKATYTNIANHIFDGVDILHFLAHGEYETDGQKSYGYFVIDGEGNKIEDRLPAEMLQSFCRVNPMQLAILSACRSDQAFQYGDTTITDLPEVGYFSMAHALIQTGVPCVIGMSHPISKIGAEILVRRFYRVVAIQGETIAKAMRQTRLELYAHMNSLLPSDWLAPVLYSRGSLSIIKARNNMEGSIHDV